MKSKRSHAMGIASAVCLLLTALASYVWAAGIVPDGLLFSLMPMVFGAAFTIAEFRRLSAIEKSQRLTAMRRDAEGESELGRSA